MIDKTVLALSDLSCIGKCSLTIALPVISAFGFSVSVLPSALLSTQTGGFDNYYFKDLSTELDSIIIHLKTLNKKFDCIYIGYLGNKTQINTAINIIESFLNKDGIVIVDPVMADNGKLYDNFDEDYPDKILKLCNKADYIFPNVTESLLLTKENSLNNNVYDKLKIICKNFAITSVDSKNIIKTYVYDRLADKSFEIVNDKIDGIYHGAGDLFASSVAACLLYGLSFEKSVIKATAFCYKSISDTKKSGNDTRFGLLFEKNLFDFIKSVKE